MAGFHIGTWLYKPYVSPNTRTTDIPTVRGTQLPRPPIPARRRHSGRTLVGGTLTGQNCPHDEMANALFFFLFFFLPLIGLSFDKHAHDTALCKPLGLDQIS